MRTTIQIDEDLLNEAKAFAAHSGQTLSKLITDALREAMAHPTFSQHWEYITLPVNKGSALLPGVNLDSSAALLDFMENRDVK